jgi:YD repeat-containing protein
LGGLQLALVYDTTLKIPANQVDTALALVEPNSFGALWKSSFHHKLAVSYGSTKALLSRGDGKVLNFIGNGAGVFTTEADNTHKLVSIAGGYRFTDVATGAQEIFDGNGTLMSLAQGNGVVLSFTYVDNLTRVQASDGRALQFVYTNNLITQIIDPTGRIIQPAYDANRNLVSLTWQDGKASQFLYENSTFPWALTGKVDENNVRFATFTYDTQGRATTSEHAGGVGRYSVSYAQPPQLVVTDVFNPATSILSRNHGWQLPGGTTVELPNGQSAGMDATSVMGMPSVTSQSQPAGSGCSAATSATAYDANGNIASKDDFTQRRTCFAYDLSRNLPIVTAEGLATTENCTAVLTANASLPAGSRKVSTQWHPDWSLVTREAQPLKITTNVYHGQADPFNGNVIASCTPAPNLLDGKPLPVVCKQVEQATLDLGGASASAYDFYSGNVVLLLHGDGADGSTVFLDSGPSPKTAVVGGGAQISTAQSRYGGASMKFNGTSSLLTYAHDTTLNLASGDFTIEASVYINSLAFNNVILQKDQSFGTTYPSYGLYVTTTGQLAGLVATGNSAGFGQTLFSATGLITTGQFYHVAFTRQGSTLRLFVNGVLVQTATQTGIALDGGKPLVIGRYPSGGGTADNWFNGYIDELRITKGVARYTVSFTAPTAAYPGPVAMDPNALAQVSAFTYDASGRLLTRKDALNRITTYTYYATSTDFSAPSAGTDPAFGLVSLLLHGDGIDGLASFSDSSSNPKPVTAGGNARISTGQSRFGGSSLYFDGVRDYVALPATPSLAMNASDFTIEMWVYRLGSNANSSRLWNPDGDYPSDVYLGIDASGNLVSYGSSAGLSWDRWAFATGIPVPVGIWKHVALVRSGGTVTLYLDGVGTVMTTSLGTAALYDANYPHVIGGQSRDLDRGLNGYVDDFRITKGLARYTANFTPSVQAFPNTGPVLDPNVIGHTAGDLQSITNAAGHVTQFTQYDRAGRLRQMVDPKGVVTDTTYTPRGWTSSVTVTPPGGAARTTSYTYDNAGQMTGAALPDGTSLGYSYDAAHRLTGVTDAKGNTVTYTLDGMGNKTGEQVKDLAGNLQRNITRVYDALNRVQQITGASN